MAEPAFKYVSAKSGHLVSRLGTGSYVGARLLPPPAEPGTIEWDEDEVVAIPLAEWGRYAKEYARCVTAGALLVKDEAAHKAWLEKQAAATTAAFEEDKKRAADEAAKSAAPSEGNASAGNAASNAAPGAAGSNAGAGDPPVVEESRSKRARGER